MRGKSVPQSSTLVCGGYWGSQGGKYNHENLKDLLGQKSTNCEQDNIRSLEVEAI